MKNILASVCGGAALVALLAGCDPHLAQISGGSQEEVWARQLGENYRSWTPQRYPAPAAYAAPKWNNARQNNRTLPVDDPEKAVDSAAEGNDVKVAPAPEELPAAAPQKADVKENKEKESAAAPAPAAPAVPEPVVKPAEQDKAQTQPKPQTQEPEGKIYVVQAEDTLSGIAQKFYGKASLEDVIFRANSKILKDRNSLSIGMRLVIPEL